MPVVASDSVQNLNFQSRTHLQRVIGELRGHVLAYAWNSGEAEVFDIPRNWHALIEADGFRRGWLRLILPFHENRTYRSLKEASYEADQLLVP